MMVHTIAKRAAAASLAGLLALAAAGCGGGGSTAAQVFPAPQVKITPLTGTHNIRTDLPIDIKAEGGRLTALTVRENSENSENGANGANGANSANSANGEDVPGQLDFEANDWTSLWALHPGATYVVQATVTNPAGKSVTETSSFQTVRASGTFSASLDWTLAASQRQTYGVGLPIVLNFSHPVADKAAVEQALVVTADKPVPGAWRWITDSQAVYRAETFWPAHQTVTLQAHLDGVQASPGVYGTTDQTYTFRIGAARISTVDVRSHRITVQVDGKVVRQYGISAGDGSAYVYTTPSGTALTMDKARIVIMTNPNVPEGAPGWYREPVPLAVRLTDSGIYLHETPGAEWCLGVANCSHGCIRQPAAEAEWFYDTSQPADVVRVEGTDRPMSWDDGWTFYQMPWKQWDASSPHIFTARATG